MMLTTIDVLRRAIRERADVYHFHDPELVPSGWVLRMLGKTVIYDIHEYNFESAMSKPWLPYSARWLVATLMYWLDMVAAKTFDGVVVVTREMEQMFGTSKPIVTLYNYPVMTDEGVRVKEDQNETMAICIGGLWKEHGLEVLLEAGAQLAAGASRPLIRVVGALDLTGVREEYASVESWERYGVEYCGVVKHSAVREHLNRCSVGIIPWLDTAENRRGVPTKLFEYMAAGIPVVASQLAAIGEIIRRHRCGVLVPPGDPCALSRAIAELLSNRGLCAQMGERGRRAVRTEYSWQQEEQKLLRFYERIFQST